MIRHRNLRCFVTTSVTLERMGFGIIVIVDMEGVGTTPEEE